MGKDKNAFSVKSTAKAPSAINKKALLIAMISLIIVIVIAVTAVVVVLLRKKPANAEVDTTSNVIEFETDWSSYSTKGGDVDSSDYKLPLTGDNGASKAESFPDVLPQVN